MILITGASGFIGQKLIYAVDGEVRVLSRTKQPNYETTVVDFQCEDIPASAFNGIDTVFHLAGFAHDLRDQVAVKDLYRKVNVEVTARLAELSVKAGVKRFIFVSSVKASTSEGVYGQTKRDAEKKLLEIGKQSSMRISIVRPALVYGPGVKGNLALMRRGIQQGWFPPLPETGNRRSMIHVDDLVRVLLLVAGDDRAAGEIFTATDGVPHSSREIYEALCQVTGKPISRWSVPKLLFDLIGKMNAHFQYKIDKLLGDEYYTAEKLEALGFKATKGLLNFDETDY